DNELTPHLIVDATVPGTRVPIEFVRDGQIVLNIAPRAVGNLEMGNDYVYFNARFSGVSFRVIVPLAAVQAIYARENGAGTTFEPEVHYEEDAVIPDTDNNGESSKKEHVTISVVESDRLHHHDDDTPPDNDPTP